MPGASDAVRTVVIRYRVDNALRFFEEDDQAWDELYWNVTGDEWPVPIERASVSVRLPAQVTGVRARGFTGGYGSTEESVEVDDLGPRGGPSGRCAGSGSTRGSRWRSPGTRS